jgi:hypothetical protein
MSKQTSRPRGEALTVSEDTPVPDSFRQNPPLQGKKQSRAKKERVLVERKYTYAGSIWAKLSPKGWHAVGRYRDLETALTSVRASLRKRGTSGYPRFRFFDITGQEPVRINISPSDIRGEQ